MSDNFEIYSNYYDLLYNDKDYEGESSYVINKLRYFNPEVKQVLELGMGTGIHANILKKKGLELTGVEISEKMASLARQKGLVCYLNDCSDFNLDKKFDAAISLFHVISYITENEKLIKTFNNVYNHLNPDGIFIFDVWYTPAVYYLKPEVKIKRVENDSIKITRIAEPTILYNKNIVEVNYEVIIEEVKNKNVTRIKETHPMRHFSLPELHLLASNSKFKILEAKEWISNYEPSERTWGICLTLKRD